MLTEIKSIISNLRISGAATTRKAVIAVGNGVLSARCTEKKWLQMVATYPVNKMGTECFAIF